LVTVVEWARPRWRDAVCRLLAAGLLALVAALVALHRAYETAEIALAGVVVRMLTSHGVHVAAERQTLYFGLGSDTPFGLRMTPECSSVFLALPLVAVGAVMIALRPSVARRVLFALVVAALAILGINQLRVVGLVTLIGWLGTDQGYYWGHTLLGSMVSIVGGASALVLFVSLSTGTRRVPGNRRRLRGEPR
jgi:exosortase/archaeosortase family protein